MTKGTIVLTPFPFTNLSTTKRRPAVIVSANNSGDDVIVAFISSRIKEPVAETELLVDPSQKDFANSGLKVKSVIKLGKLVTVEKSILLGELGKLTENSVADLDAKLRIAFGL